MTLRRRLVMLVVGLSAIGLVVSTVVGTALLRRFVLHRVDRQLVSVSGFGGGRGRGAERGADGPGFGPGQNGPADPTNPTNLCRRDPRAQFGPQGIVTEFYRRDGSAVCDTQSGDDPGGGPAVQKGDLLRTGGRAFTLSGHSSGHEYRVVVNAFGNDVVVVRAIDLGEANATWRDQALAGALLSLATLIAIGVLGLWLVHRGLRPLEEITDTADAIAAGDRSQRAAVTDPSGEVGRLGLAFNTMLESIDAAFVEQQRSEDKLRQFVADASHELRTPLTSIRGYAELQLAGGAATPAKLETSMRNIKRESERMGGLVEDLLMLARMDREPQLQLSDVHLARLVDDAVADLRARDASRQVATAATAPVHVAGDEGRLRQVLANLVGNACTHTPAGTPIELSLSEHAGRAEIRVIDHGHGVPAEMREHIFERFARLDPSRTRASGGAGLGLAIVSAIVSAHRGVVRVEPTPGGGATFVVSLPLTAVSTTDGPERAASGASVPLAEPGAIVAQALSPARSGLNG